MRKDQGSTPETAESVARAPESVASAAKPATSAAEPAVEAAASAPVADSVLLGAESLARKALLEITPADSIGAVIGSVVEGEHVLSLLFDCALPGYPGWRWTATLSRVDENSAPTVLEIELLPGEDAVIAPDWVPWAERMADQRASQESADGDDGHDGDDDDGDDDLDDDDLDDEDDEDEDEDDDDDDDDIDETDLVDDELDDALDHLDEDDIIQD